MKLDLVRKMGKKAFVQSISHYKGEVSTNVHVFGLDTEFVPKTDKPSELISWQISGDSETKFIQGVPLSLSNICQEALKMLPVPNRKTLVFVCFFSLAEIQFFNLSEWVLSEFKGKYRLNQNYGEHRVMVVDLADWYQGESLKNVATLWGFEKMEFPIGKKVEAIEAGEMTVQDLLDDPEFVKYAKHDAYITQKIYKEMREFFLSSFGVDITRTLTPAATSAAMFRMGIKNPIGQRDTVLRTLALQCCWGGRMESLYRGKKDKVFEYDATAHHPTSVIALGVLPEEADWKRTQHLKVWLSGISGVGKVYFKFRDNELYPCLPVMMEDALVYVKEGVSLCTVTEARLAKKKGATLVLYDGYYYSSGTTVLSDYLKRIQALRNETEDPARRKLFKLLSNAVIGKFFQKNSGIDLAKVQKYADEHGIPYEEAIKLDGVDFGEGEVKVGALFYPEWYSLILGYARASISAVAERHKALIISSDSFVTEEDLGDGFEAFKISFHKKAEGELISYRTRFYRVGEKLAHHAVHNKKAAGEVLEDFKQEDKFAYTASRILHLRESWAVKKPFGCRIIRPMTTSLGYDYKRRLLEDGLTEPWQTTEERLEFMKGGKNATDSNESGSSVNSGDLAKGSNQASFPW